MKPKSGNTIIGQAIFYGTLGAVFVFFWWFLIFDHGVGSTH